MIGSFIKTSFRTNHKRKVNLKVLILVYAVTIKMKSSSCNKTNETRNVLWENHNLSLTEKEAVLGRNICVRSWQYGPRTTERSEVRTKTTEGQYSPVRPSRSVSKRLLYACLFISLRSLGLSY